MKGSKIAGAAALIAPLGSIPEVARSQMISKEPQAATQMEKEMQEPQSVFAVETRLAEVGRDLREAKLASVSRPLTEADYVEARRQTARGDYVAAMDNLDDAQRQLEDEMIDVSAPNGSF